MRSTKLNRNHTDGRVEKQWQRMRRNLTENMERASHATLFQMTESVADQQRSDRRRTSSDEVKMGTIPYRLYGVPEKST